jgi:hypothetical protein
MSSEQQHVRVIISLVVLLCVMAALLAVSLTRPDFITKLSGVNDIEIVNLDADVYLHDEEMVMIDVVSDATTTEAIPIDRVLFEYVAVVDSCGPHFDGECLNVRSGPGTDYPQVAKLRRGMVLKIDGQVEREVGSSTQLWYKVVFDEWLRYPERLTSDWYVAADYVDVLLDEGDKTSWEDGNASTSKRIEVTRSTQRLAAYDGDELFMEADISTGLAMTPTPAGTFTIFKKTPSRYMQGPLPNVAASGYYDLPGVPWNLYFTHGGAVIHGAYWHDSFGSQYSHGCVNLPINTARELYHWAELGTKVIVK